MLTHVQSTDFVVIQPPRLICSKSTVPAWCKLTELWGQIILWTIVNDYCSLVSLENMMAL